MGGISGAPLTALDFDAGSCAGTGSHLGRPVARTPAVARRSNDLQSVASWWVGVWVVQKTTAAADNSSATSARPPLAREESMQSLYCCNMFSIWIPITRTSLTNVGHVGVTYKSFTGRSSPATRTIGSCRDIDLTSESSGWYAHQVLHTPHETLASGQRRPWKHAKHEWRRQSSLKVYMHDFVSPRPSLNSTGR